jgi:hypothetical protein
VCTANQCALQPFVRALTRAAKSVFNIRNIHEFTDRFGNVHTIKIVMPDLAKDGFRIIIDDVNTYVVCGDDSLFKGSENAIHEFMRAIKEGDYSKYDVSQELWIWLMTFTEVLYPCGASEEEVELIYQEVVGPFKMDCAGLRVRGILKPQMPTGSALTYVVGSLHNIGFFLTSVYHGLPMTEICGLCGMRLVEQNHEQLQGATFLKMVAVNSLSNDIEFLPMFGALLKIGKTLAAHKTIAGRKYGDDCSAIVLACSLQSIGLLAGNYRPPLFGAVRRMVDRLLGAINVDDTEMERIYKRYLARRGDDTTHRPYTEAVWVGANWGAYLDVMCQRYAITRDDVSEVEQMFDSVSALPVYLEHPLFDRLRDVDYA